MNIYTFSHGELATATSHPLEDAFSVNADHGIMVVADGVTRDRTAHGDYPNPSPALQAANVFCETMLRLLSAQPDSEASIVAACAVANEAIAELNVTLGITPKVDYLEHDFAGVVGAVAIVRDRTLYWAYIGDCGIAVLDNAEGGIVWETPDEVMNVQPHFPPKQDTDRATRMTTIRKDFRNNPSAAHPTYGVLTGEEAALGYVRTGTRQLAPGERVMTFTDGGRNFLHDPALRVILLRAPEHMESMIAALPGVSITEDTTLLVTDPVV